MNLLEVFSNFKRYGAWSAYVKRESLLVSVFSMSWNTASWAKNSTSCQLLPSSSVQEIISVTPILPNAKR